MQPRKHGEIFVYCLSKAIAEPRLRGVENDAHDRVEIQKSEFKIHCSELFESVVT